MKGNSPADVTGAFTGVTGSKQVVSDSSVTDDSFGNSASCLSCAVVPLINYSVITWVCYNASSDK